MNAAQKYMRVMKVKKYLEAEDFYNLALALGMTDQMLEEMPVMDFMDAIKVRLSDFMREIEGEVNRDE